MRKKSINERLLWLIQTVHPNQITYHMGKQWMCSDKFGGLAPVIKKISYRAQVKPFNCLLPVLSLSLSYLKPFNCLALVLSLFVFFFFSYLLHQYTVSHNPTVMQQMQQQQCWDYFFYTSFGWPKFACHKPRPTRDETRDPTKDTHASVFFLYF